LRFNFNGEIVDDEDLFIVLLRVLFLFLQRFVTGSVGRLGATEGSSAEIGLAVLKFVRVGAYSYA
jgi:hypothetical protein